MSVNRGSDRGRLPAEMRPELVSRVAARKGRLRRPRSQKTAERLPPFRWSENQKPVSRDRVPHPFVVAPVSADGALAVGAAENPLDQDLVHRLEDRGDVR